MSTYRPQGEGRPVRVLRRPYTPRDRLLGDRRNIELRLRAEIPKNSYLFVWRGEHKELDLRPVLRFVKDSLDRGQIPGNLEQRIADASKAIGTSKVKEPPTVRDKPYIPSSSIKGAVRSRLEYKFSPKKIKDEFISESCYIVQDGEVGKRHRGFWGDECIQKRQGPCTLQEGGENVCIVCDMFGTASLSSRIEFSNAVMTSGYLELLKDLGIRAFKPESSFSLQCHARNINHSELGLLYLGLELLSGSPILIGFRKYLHNPRVGQPYADKYYFGLLKFRLEGVTTYGIDLSIQQVDPTESIKNAKAELEQSEYDSYLDYARGLI